MTMLRIFLAATNIGFPFVVFAKRVADIVCLSVWRTRLILSVEHISGIYPAALRVPRKIFLAPWNSVTNISSDRFCPQLLASRFDYMLSFIICLSFDMDVKLMLEINPI